MRRGGAGTGGGVRNWFNEPTLALSRQGLIGPMKGPAPQEERSEEPVGAADDRPTLQTAKCPFKPVAVKYGRKANHPNNTSTTTTPRKRVDDVKIKRKDSSSNRKKVVAMSMKERKETQTKMKDIKTLYMGTESEARRRFQRNGH